MSDNNVLLDHLLAELHNLYQQTRNPVFVWLALDYCSDRYWPQTELPTWCREYLFVAASKFENLINQPAPVGTRKSVKPSPTQVLAALGLSEQGKNLFRNAWAAMVKVRAAKNYNLAVKSPTKAKDAACAVKQALGLVNSDDRSAYRVVAEGETLSSGPHPPRRRSGKRKVT